jgi:hypothetical protein
MTDPGVVEAVANEILSKLRAKQSQRDLDMTQREERALQLEINMLDLGGQRVRYELAQARAEKATADADERAAISRQGEAESMRLEAEINLVAGQLEAELTEVTRRSEITQTELDAEEDIRARMSASKHRIETSRMNYNELAEELRKLRITRTRFIQSIGSMARARQEKFKPMSGEMAAVYGAVTPAQRLLDYDQSIIDMERKLQGSI